MNRKFRLLIIAVILVLATSASLIHAQGPVRTIPATGLLVNIALSPDGRTLATFDDPFLYDTDTLPPPESLVIHLIDLESGQEIGQLTGATDFAMDGAFSPDGETLVTYHQNGFIYVWDVAAGEARQVIPAIREEGGIEFLPNGEGLITQMNEFLTTYLLWDVETWHITSILSHRFESQVQMGAVTNEMRIEGTAPYQGIAFAVSPNSEIMVNVAWNGQIWQWQLGDDFLSMEGMDVPANSAPTVLRPRIDEMPNLPVRRIIFTPDGESLLYYSRGSRDDETLVAGFYRLDLATRTETLLAAEVGSPAFALAPDGDTLAWGDPTSGTLFFTTLSDMDTVNAVELPLPEAYSARFWNSGWGGLSFTPDNSQLVVSGLSDSESSENFVFVVDVP